MALTVELDQAAAAYDRLAPFYDRFTAGYRYDDWVGTIESRACELGMRGRRALDIACGTGKSTEPLLARGYSVLGCDISPEMVREAQSKFPAQAEAFFVADMRNLSLCDEFNLVVCLDDAINHLLSDDELEATFAGVADSLSPEGIFAFDLNSLRTYRTAFAQPMVREADGLLFVWRGEGDGSVEEGGSAAATVEVFARQGDGLWERSSSRHVQRHHPHETVLAALAAGGLECCGVAGQLRGAKLEPVVDEERHIKRVYFARRAR